MLLIKPSIFLAICSMIMLSLLLSDDPHYCHDILNGLVSANHRFSHLLLKKTESQEFQPLHKFPGNQKLSTPFQTGKTQSLSYQTTTVPPERELPNSFRVFSQNIAKPDLMTKVNAKSKAEAVSLHQESSKIKSAVALPSAFSGMTHSTGKRVKSKLRRKARQREKQPHVSLLSGRRKKFQNDAQLTWQNGKSFIRTQMKDKVSHPEGVNELSKTVSKEHLGRFSETFSEQLTVPEILKMKALIKTTPSKDESLIKGTRAWYENYISFRHKTPGDHYVPSGSGKFEDEMIQPSRSDFVFGVQTSKLPSARLSGRSLALQRGKRRVEGSPPSTVPLNALNPNSVSLQTILYRQREPVEQRKENSPLLSLNENVYEERFKRMAPLEEKILPDTGFIPKKKKTPIELIPTPQLNTDNQHIKVYNTGMPNISNQTFTQGKVVVNTGITHNIAFDSDMSLQEKLHNLPRDINNRAEAHDHVKNFNNNSFLKVHNSTRIRADIDYSKNKSASNGRWDINNKTATKIFHSSTDANYINKSLEGSLRNGPFGEENKPTNHTKNYTEKPTTDVDHFNIQSSKGTDKNFTHISNGNKSASPSERNDSSLSTSGSNFETGIKNSFTVVPKVLRLNESSSADSFLNINSSVQFPSEMTNEGNVVKGCTPTSPGRNVGSEGTDSYLNTEGNRSLKVNKSLDELFTISFTPGNITQTDEVYRNPEEMTTGLYDMNDVSGQVTTEITIKRNEDRDGGEFHIPNNLHGAQNNIKNESSAGNFSGFGGTVPAERRPQGMDTVVQSNGIVLSNESRSQTANGASIIGVHSHEAVAGTTENIGNSTDLITTNAFERITNTVKSETEYDQNGRQLSSPKEATVPTLSEDGNEVLSYSTQVPKSSTVHLEDVSTSSNTKGTTVSTWSEGGKEVSSYSTQEPKIPVVQLEGKNTLADKENHSNGNGGFPKTTYVSMTWTDFTELLDTVSAADEKSSEQFSSGIKTEVLQITNVEERVSEEYVTQSTPYSEVTAISNEDENTVSLHYVTLNSKTANNHLNEKTTPKQSFSQTGTEVANSVPTEITARETSSSSTTPFPEGDTTRDNTNTFKINEHKDLTNSLTTTSLGIVPDGSLEADYERSVEKENGMLNNLDKEHRMKRDGNSKEDNTDISSSQLGGGLIPKVEINGDLNLGIGDGSNVKNLNPVTVDNIEDTILSPTEQKGIMPTGIDESEKVLNNSNTGLTNNGINQNGIPTIRVPIGGINTLGDVNADVDLRLNLTHFPNTGPNTATTKSFISSPSEEEVQPTSETLDNSRTISRDATDGILNDPQTPSPAGLPNTEDASEFSGERTISTLVDDNTIANEFSTPAMDKTSEKTQAVTESATRPSTSSTISDSSLNNEKITSSTADVPVDNDSPPPDTVDIYSSPGSVVTDQSSFTLALTTPQSRTTMLMSTSDSRSVSSSESSTSSSVKPSSSTPKSEDVNNQVEGSSSTRSNVEIKPTSLETSTMLSVIPFHFTIDADYDKIVGNRKEEFQDNLKTQLAKVMRLPHDCITDLKVTRGSVEVSFTLVPDPSYGHIADEEAIKAAADELKRKIDNGELSLADLDGNTLVIVPIDPPTTSPPILVKEHTTLILGIVIGLFIVIVITIAIIAVVVKNKSLGGRRLSPIEEARSKLPSYREIPFQEALYVKGNGKGLHQGKYCYDSGRWLGPGPEPQTRAPNVVAYRPPTDLQIRNTPRPSSLVRSRLKNSWDLDWDQIMPDR